MTEEKSDKEKSEKEIPETEKEKSVTHFDINISDSVCCDCQIKHFYCKCGNKIENISAICSEVSIYSYKSIKFSDIYKYMVCIKCGLDWCLEKNLDKEEWKDGYELKDEDPNLSPPSSPIKSINNLYIYFIDLQNRNIYEPRTSIFKLWREIHNDKLNIIVNENAKFILADQEIYELGLKKNVIKIKTYWMTISIFPNNKKLKSGSPLALIKYINEISLKDQIDRIEEEFIKNLYEDLSSVSACSSRELILNELDKFSICTQCKGELMNCDNYYKFKSVFQSNSFSAMPKFEIYKSWYDNMIKSEEICFVNRYKSNLLILNGYIFECYKDCPFIKNFVNEIPIQICSSIKEENLFLDKKCEKIKFTLENLKKKIDKFHLPPDLILHNYKLIEEDNIYLCACQMIYDIDNDKKLLKKRDELKDKISEKNINYTLDIDRNKIEKNMFAKNQKELIEILNNSVIKRKYPYIPNEEDKTKIICKFSTEKISFINPFSEKYYAHIPIKDIIGKRPYDVDKILDSCLKKFQEWLTEEKILVISREKHMLDYTMQNNLVDNKILEIILIIPVYKTKIEKISSYVSKITDHCTLKVFDSDKSLIKKYQKLFDPHQDI